MSVAPKLKRLVLFKHGVAYLERGGAADGPFELRFRRAEMNDVLKSLTTIVVEGDARVGGVSFESADDPAEALDARNLLVGAGEALATVLGAVRGRRVRADDGAAVEGEVIGVESTPIADGAVRRQLLLRTDGGALQLVDLGSLRQLELLDPASRADLDFLIDKSRAMTAGDVRMVKVDLVGRADDLRVAYIVPAPTWRVSYRVALAPEGDADGARLLAWAIVHNPADEDVDGAELILTTGQPVSFEIDLYAPKRLQRAVIEEESRAAPAPRRIHAAMKPAAFAAPMPAAGPAGFGPPPGMAAPQAYGAEATRSLGDALLDAGDGAADLGQRGELFEYKVANPVSMRRGGSAMVPIVSARLDVRKDRVWRLGDPPPPDLVATFDNASGAVLEEGPAVVYEGGGYAGEAMIPYAARGAEVRFTYAKDLAIRCTATTETREVAVGVRLGEGVVIEDQLREFVHAVRVESDLDAPTRVLIELPRSPRRVLRTGTPTETTAHGWRFAVEIPPRGKAELEVSEGQPLGRHTEVGNLDPAQLAAWLERKFLDQELAGGLRAVIAKEQEARAFERNRESLARTRMERHEEIQRIAQQLGVLAQHGPEGHLRLRYAQQMEAAQSAVAAAETEMRALERLAGEARGELRKMFADLLASSPRPTPP